MKAKLLFLMLLGQILFSYGQSIQINQITPTAVSGGVNVNLLVTTFNGAGYLDNSYSITGNTINLSVCYWFNITLPVYQISNDFFIPLTDSGIYTINVSTFNSSSTTECDYFSTGPIGTTTVLSTGDFAAQKNSLKLYPNPTSGKVNYIGNNSEVKNIKIFDNYGRLVRDIFDREIDFSGLSEGIYMVRTETENNIFNQKIVVER